MRATNSWPERCRFRQQGKYPPSLMAAKDSGFLGCDVGLYSQKGNLFHTLVIHLPGLQRTDVGINDAGDGFMNFPD